MQQLHRYHLNHLLLSLLRPQDHPRPLNKEAKGISNPPEEVTHSLDKQTIDVSAVEQDLPDLMNWHSDLKYNKFNLHRRTIFLN